MCRFFCSAENPQSLEHDLRGCEEATGQHGEEVPTATSNENLIFLTTVMEVLIKTALKSYVQ